MGANTKIEWANMTWNCWRGCSKVSAGCAHCYASTQSKRNPGVLGVWGPNGTRVVAAESYWRLPVKWNREAGWQESAAAAGTANERPRPRVFCGSLMDVFEDWQGNMLSPHQCESDTGRWNPILWHRDDIGVCEAGQTTMGHVRGERLATLADVRRRLFATIDATPNLDWLLVTKWPENVLAMLQPVIGVRDMGGDIGTMSLYRHNVWLLTSVEDQATADERIPHLLACRDLAPVLGLSVEPLLGPVDLSPWLDRLDWCIVGGESGPHARPCNVDWIRSIVAQCKAAGVPCYVKQLGTRPVWLDCFRGSPGSVRLDTYDMPGGEPDDIERPFLLRDPKGGDPAEWSQDLRVREFPANH